MSVPIQNEKKQASQPDGATSSQGFQDKNGLLHFALSQADHIVELDFPMRGHSLNPLVDAAQTLFGMVIRIKRGVGSADVNELYTTVSNEIEAITEEVRQLDYEPASQLAYRYALCAFIDEAVMSTDWGGASSWRDRSLLSRYHNETWGGEKFFTVLERMQMDPVRYQHVLEFKYTCLCLGFEGKYGQQHDRQEVLNGLIRQLHGLLRKVRGEAPKRLMDDPVNVVARGYRLPRVWPLWTPWVLAAVVLTGVYVYFLISLENMTEQVIRSLDFVLRP